MVVVVGLGVTANPPPGLAQVWAISRGFDNNEGGGKKGVMWRHLNHTCQIWQAMGCQSQACK